MTAATNYPADPRKVPRLPIATYLAVMLEELGFPTLLDDDMARLRTTVEDFLYQRAGGGQ